MYTITKICKDDFSKIENYYEAISDTTQTWDCHHRRETDEGLSVMQLKELGLYYNRPASELIFLTHAEHNRLHYKDKPKSEEHKKNLSESMKGEKNPMYGKHHTEEWKQKNSESQKGEKSNMYGKPAHIRGKHRVWNDENDHSKGYHYEN